ncbi:LytR/AlgR family response regulator transcription factor [Chitinophaga sp. Hz27]|uniref:LytR/AlgR family response regulator transcription factor n=1 Tax=Chitinophaga sp. Hz27 TaxID=3347169 RepID=UPI0035E004EB
MRVMNCMVVDDEPIARDIIISYINQTPGLQLVAACSSAIEAYEALHTNQVDLLWLDIQMPVITGTDFLRSLPAPPLVIFTTAFSDFAVEGFELNSVDYLLKPITYQRFLQATQKARERFAAKALQSAPPAEKPDLNYLFIRDGSKLIRLEYDQIRYIEAEKDYSYVFLKDRKLLLSMHLKQLEQLLPAHLFMRIHRSYVVKLSSVKAIKGNVVEVDALELPIGASYKAALFTALQINGG